MTKENKPFNPALMFNNSHNILGKISIVKQLSE